MNVAHDPVASRHISLLANLSSSCSVSLWLWFCPNAPISAIKSKTATDTLIAESMLSQVTLVNSTNFSHSAEGIFCYLLCTGEEYIWLYGTDLDPYDKADLLPFSFTELTEVYSFCGFQWNLAVKCTYVFRDPNPVVYLVLLNLLMMETRISLQPRLALAQGKMLLTQSSHLLIFSWLCVLFGVFCFVLFACFIKITCSLIRLWSFPVTHNHELDGGRMTFASGIVVIFLIALLLLEGKASVWYADCLMFSVLSAILLEQFGVHFLRRNDKDP